MQVQDSEMNDIEASDFQDATGFGDSILDASGVSLSDNKAEVMQSIAKSYLDSLDKDVIHNPDDVASEIIRLIRQAFEVYNAVSPRGGKWRLPDSLPPEIVSLAMLELHTIKNINCSEESSEKDYDLLGIYHENGPNAGIYVSDETEIRKLIRRYNYSFKMKDVKEVIALLKDNAPHVQCCSDPDLCVVGNGIFNFKTKILNPFDPDLVFLSKCHVDYNFNAVNVQITDPNDGYVWTIEDWIKGFWEDGSELPELIWEVIGAAVRYNVRWDKAVFLYSTKGNNGKGCIAQLIRNLIGSESYVSIPISSLSKEFVLEALVGKSAVITDENDVGTYIDKCANFKAIITNDVIQINRKFKTPINYRFRGIMLHCLNSLPLMSDKTSSLLRRILIVPFEKSFTGAERKYIKDDYLRRNDVLQYVLYRVLNMDYYEFSNPSPCEKELENYRVLNDPVQDFLNEILPKASVNCIPSALLYDMFKSWYAEVCPKGKVRGRNTFLNDVRSIIDPNTNGGWYYVGSDNQKRLTDHFNTLEPLLDEFNCEKWMTDPESRHGTGRMRIKKKPSHAYGLFNDRPIARTAKGVVRYD